MWGEAGIGKTWTLERILQSTGFGHVKVNVNISVTDLIRVLPRVKRLPVWAERLFEKVERGEDVGTSSVADAIGALLTAQAPIILCFEDLHEASLERLELLIALSELVSRSIGVALVVTSRNELPAAFEAFKLEPLTIAESKALLETQVNSDLPVQANLWIYARAAGNPLFTLEFLRFLVRGGHIWNDGSLWHWRIPPNDLMPVTVEALIERLIDQALTTPSVQTALETKAVLPFGTSEPVLVAISNLKLERWRDAITELERRNVFSAGEFAHPLFREVVLHNLSNERRRELSRQALSALKADPAAAAHFVEDAKLEPPEALAWLKRAAQNANEHGNEVQVAQFQARAVEYAAGEERGTLAFEAAKGLVNHHEKIRLAHIALSQMPGNAEIIFLLAQEYTSLDQPSEMNRVLEMLPEQQRTGMAWLERLVYLLGNLSDSAAVLQLWHDHPELHQSVNGRVLLFVSMALTSSSKHEDANALIDQALANPKLRQSDRGLLLNGKGVDLLQRSNYFESEKLFSQAIDLLVQTKDLNSVISPLINRSWARHMLGLYQESLEDLSEAEQLCIDSGDAQLLAAMQMFKANLLTEFGDFEQAEELLLESRKVMQWESIPVHLADCEDTISRLYHDWQTPHASVLSLKHARIALELAQVVGRPRQVADKLHVASLAETRYGNPSRGLQLAKEALELSAAPGLLEQHCTAQFALGLALERSGQKSEAIRAFEHALELAEQLELGLVTHKMALELDRLTQNLESARMRFTWFDERGLKNGANLAKRYFKELDTIKNTNPTQTNLHLARLEVLGKIQLLQNGVSQAIRGQKRKELLALLLEARIAGRSEIPQFELLETLYPESIPEEAGVALKQLVFQMRSSYGQGVINTTSHGYALGAVESDAEDFLSSGKAQLWRGLYLEDVLHLPVDETVREALYHLLLSKSESLLTTDSQETQRLGRILLEALPYDLQVLKLCLKAFQENQNYRSLSRLYVAAQARLLEVGERLPEDWRDFLGLPLA